MKPYVLAAVFFASLASGHASAQETGPMTARSLVEGCDALVTMEAGENEPSGWNQERAIGGVLGAGVCLGYIKGFFGGYNFARHDATGPNVQKICIPSGVTHPQIARLLSTRLRASPELEHIDAYPFLIAVLSSTWPCGADQSRKVK
ncbi:Rap1a/Tai family immunity protein [Stenotrophomonas maltophilia]|uniref:Rap1a/Tai family immunity protein n=1 Tax=Stenotrophomonas maltophilia TaxID=40324 RepID=UPI0015DFD014|nr:Rap1a/Tai family immunity protein [Stenotrophomonas maltophilia]